MTTSFLCFLIAPITRSGVGANSGLYITRKYLVCFLVAFLTMLIGLSAYYSCASANSALVLSLEDERWVDLIKSNQPYIIVDVTVNRKIIPALIDTGSASTLIDIKVAQDLGMKIHSRGQIGAIGGQVNYYEADLTSLSIGGVHRRGGRVGVVDMNPLRGAVGDVFSVIIGADILAHYAFEVDWDHSRLRLTRSGSKNIHGTPISLHIEPEYNRFISKITIGNHDLEKVILDTGADNSAIRKFFIPRIEGVEDRLTDIKGVGIGGETVVDFGRVDRIKLGDIYIDSLPVEFPPVVCACSEHYQARIGMNLLRRFNFLIDASAGHIIVSPRSVTTPTENTSTSGIQGILTSDGLDIVHVMRRSPAATAGLKPGDRICAVDGAPMDADWVVKGRRKGWSTDTPGKQVILQLCDGRTVQLTLAEFY